MRVGIVGAGIAGLTAGYALSKQGIEVNLFERSDSITEFGAGITLSKNATILLGDLGLLDSIADIGFHPGKSFIRDYKKCNVINSMELDDNFLTLDRRDLVEQLDLRFKEAKGIIHTNKEVTSINPSTGTLSFTNHQDETYDLVLVCDGIRSSLRDSNFEGQEPRFTNYIAWRGMTQITRVPKFEDSDKVNVYYGPGSHWVHYPIGRDEMVNFVAIEKNPKWSGESWKVEGAKTDFLKSFEGWNDDLISMAMSSERLYKWGIFERPLPKTLYNGRAILLGDAAHPMVPFLGQGGCLAIEDAYCLSALINQITDLEKALSIFDEMRNNRSRWIQKRSRLQGSFNHISNPLLIPIRNIFAKTFMKKSVQNLHSYNLNEELSLKLQSRL